MLDWRVANAMNHTGQERACADHLEKQKYLIVHNNGPAISSSIETKNGHVGGGQKAKVPDKNQPNRRTETSQIAEQNRAKMPKSIAKALMMRYHRGCEVMT